MAKQEYIANAGGIRMVGTSHAVQRLLRKSKMNAVQVRDMLRGICIYFQINKAKILKDHGYNGEIFYYCQTYQKGCIVSARADFKDPEEMILALITVYPDGARSPMQPDTPSITIDKRS